MARFTEAVKDICHARRLLKAKETIEIKEIDSIERYDALIQEDKDGYSFLFEKPDSEYERSHGASIDAIQLAMLQYGTISKSQAIQHVMDAMLRGGSFVNKLKHRFPELAHEVGIRTNDYFRFLSHSFDRALHHDMGMSVPLTYGTISRSLPVAMRIGGYNENVTRMVLGLDGSRRITAKHTRLLTKKIVRYSDPGAFFRIQESVLNIVAAIRGMGTFRRRGSAKMAYLREMVEKYIPAALDGVSRTSVDGVAEDYLRAVMTGTIIGRGPSSGAYGAIEDQKDFAGRKLSEQFPGAASAISRFREDLASEVISASGELEIRIMQAFEAAEIPWIDGLPCDEEEKPRLKAEAVHIAQYLASCVCNKGYGSQGKYETLSKAPWSNQMRTGVTRQEGQEHKGWRHKENLDLVSELRSYRNSLFEAGIDPDTSPLCKFAETWSMMFRYTKSADFIVKHCGDHVSPAHADLLRAGDKHNGVLRLGMTAYVPEACKLLSLDTDGEPILTQVPAMEGMSFAVSGDTGVGWSDYEVSPVALLTMVRAYALKQLGQIDHNHVPMLIGWDESGTSTGSGAALSTPYAASFRRGRDMSPLLSLNPDSPNPDDGEVFPTAIPHASKCAGRRPFTILLDPSMLPFEVMDRLADALVNEDGSVDFRVACPVLKYANNECQPASIRLGEMLSKQVAGKAFTWRMLRKASLLDQKHTNFTNRRLITRGGKSVYVPIITCQGLSIGDGNENAHVDAFDGLAESPTGGFERIMKVMADAMASYRNAPSRYSSDSDEEYVRRNFDIYRQELVYFMQLKAAGFYSPQIAHMIACPHCGSTTPSNTSGRSAKYSLSGDSLEQICVAPLMFPTNAMYGGHPGYFGIMPHILAAHIVDQLKEEGGIHPDCIMKDDKYDMDASWKRYTGRGFHPTLQSAPFNPYAWKGLRFVHSEPLLSALADKLREIPHSGWMHLYPGAFESPMIEPEYNNTKGNVIKYFLSAAHDADNLGMTPIFYRGAKFDKIDEYVFNMLHMPTMGQGAGSIWRMLCGLAEGTSVVSAMLNLAFRLYFGSYSQIKKIISREEGSRADVSHPRDFKSVVVGMPAAIKNQPLVDGGGYNMLRELFSKEVLRGTLVLMNAMWSDNNSNSGQPEGGMQDGAIGGAAAAAGRDLAEEMKLEAMADGGGRSTIVDCSVPAAPGQRERWTPSHGNVEGATYNKMGNAPAGPMQMGSVNDAPSAVVERIMSVLMGAYIDGAPEIGKNKRPAESAVITSEVVDAGKFSVYTNVADEDPNGQVVIDGTTYDAVTSASEMDKYEYESILRNVKACVSKAKRAIEKESSEHGRSAQNIKSLADIGRALHMGGMPSPGVERTIVEDFWGTMELVDSPEMRTIKVPGYVRGRDRTPARSGAVLKYPSRFTSNKKIFCKKGDEPGVSMVVDASGSMGLSAAELAMICMVAPASTVALYNGSGTIGQLRVVMKNGMMVPGHLIDPPYGCNVVDGLAARWLARQPEPRLMVCDMGVHGKGKGSMSLSVLGDYQDGLLDFFTVLAANNIMLRTSVAGALMGILGSDMMDRLPSITGLEALYRAYLMDSLRSMVGPDGAPVIPNFDTSGSEHKRERIAGVASRNGMLGTPLADRVCHQLFDVNPPRTYFYGYAASKFVGGT